MPLPKLALCCLQVVGILAVIGQIQTFFLCIVASADTDRVLQDQQDHEGNETGPDQRGTDGPHLRNELCRGIEISDLVGNVIVYACSAECRIDEYAGTEGADDTAYAVHAERIKCIVILQLGLDYRYREEGLLLLPRRSPLHRPHLHSQPPE